MSKILVIEDEWAVREMIVEILRAHGYEVDAAPDGKSGLHKLESYKPDLILCDINMPEMNGFQVLETLRQKPGRNGTLFLFLTALSDRSNNRRGMELGADDYITKPFEPEDLLRAVQTQLAKRQSIEQHHATTLNLLKRNIIHALPHELRTPLGVIMGNAELLAMDAHAFGPEEVQQMAQAIVKHSRRLHNLFENYLIYAQIELIASDPVEREALRNHLIRDAGAIIEKGALEEAQAAVPPRTTDLQLSTIRIALRMSDDNLNKIVKELVSNACKFSKPGTPVIVQALREGDDFVLSIRDQGHGMTTEQINQIGAYMQFDRRIYEQQGLGLGLFVTKRLVELHGGTLQIISAPEQGTEVRVRLPLYD
ncbi:MAG: hybrid sensor histidine kinase/response regulator [Anaerolineae bacterium]